MHPSKLIRNYKEAHLRGLRDLAQRPASLGARAQSSEVALEVEWVFVR